mgnify:CR=1 FL=1
MKKLGRPKKNSNNDNNVFVGMKMPKDLAESITKDAGKHFRMRTQHILWILSDYIKGVSEEATNQPLYTTEELEDMYEDYKRRGEQ